MSPSIKQKKANPVFLVALVLVCFVISRSVQAGQAPDVQNVNEFNTPFQREFSIQLRPGVNYAEDTITIPEGKTLVVEFVSAKGDFPAGEQPKWLAILQHGTSFLLWNFQASANDRDVFVASQQTRYYTNDLLLLSVYRDVAAGTATIHGCVIGYLVNTP